MLYESPSNRLPSSQNEEGIALYIHWPFCLSKCPYCDFNSFVAKNVPQERFAQALINELRHSAEQQAAVPLNSIYFGGGTPSLMSPSTVEALIDQATQLFRPKDSLEITLEANPTSVEIDRLTTFRKAGVNRVSLGIQSLDPVSLKALGRQHSVAQAIDALTLARKIFPRVSFDLIYAREGQTLNQWEKELHQALTLVNDHLSLYQLTIEEGTVFARQYEKGQITLPDESLSADMLVATQTITNAHGLLNYEVSNYAQAGAESKHNLAYWRYQDYIGIGPGAHGRIRLNQQLYATERIRNPTTWLKATEKQGHGLSIMEPLSPADKAREMLLMGLRLSEGVNATNFAKRCGISLIEAVNEPILKAAIEEDYLHWDQKILRATSSGRLRLNTLLEALLN